MEVNVDFDPWWFEGHCVHAAGNIYWHISASGRLLALDPATLDFSYLSVPAELGDNLYKFRIGETPEDGRLCTVTVDHEEMQLWVREDNGWLLERKMNLNAVWDLIPGLPRDKQYRHIAIWIGDIDAGRTGKLFINTYGYGRYSFHLGTGKLEHLATADGKDYGHPMYAYFLA